MRDFFAFCVTSFVLPGLDGKGLPMIFIVVCAISVFNVCISVSHNVFLCDSFRAMN